MSVDLVSKVTIAQNSVDNCESTPKQQEYCWADSHLYKQMLLFPLSNPLYLRLNLPSILQMSEFSEINKGHNNKKKQV